MSSTTRQRTHERGCRLTYGTYESDIAVARSVVEAAAREVDIVIDGGPDIRVGSGAVSGVADGVHRRVR